MIFNSSYEEDVKILSIAKQVVFVCNQQFGIIIIEERMTLRAIVNIDNIDIYNGF